MRNLMGWRGVVCVLVLVCIGVLAVPSHAQVLPYRLKVEKVLNNTAELGDMAQSPTGQLWLLERASGTIRIFDAGREQATLTLSVDSTCESGLLDVAFDPSFHANGRALVYYVDAAGNVRVDEVIHRGASLQLGSQILSLGSSPGGCRLGGGMAIGSDGKLYVSVGDMEDSTNAQDDSVLQGKVLRAELDGSVPADNASGTLVWAKGFRNVKDLAERGGTVYAGDVGLNPSTYDELNAVHEGGNYGWDQASGNSGGAYEDPLVEYVNPTVDPEGLEALSGGMSGGLAIAHDGIAMACVDANDVREVTLVSPEVLREDRLFYDPNGGFGAPDAECPHQINALAEGADGWLYAANMGTNPGIWRVYQDGPGPREVSGPGSPFQITLGKTAGVNLTLGWENLTELDASRPSRNGGQHPRAYQIWEGTLASLGTYDHTPILATDGAVQQPALREWEITPDPDEDTYYLVTAQGDNFEGTAGFASSGAERPAAEDYCSTLIGYGINAPPQSPQQCAANWFDHETGGELYLRDLNPNSPTYLQEITMSDFRGQVVRMDLSALNCPPCQAQAQVLHIVQEEYRERDLTMISVMNQVFQTLAPINPSVCAAAIAGWANTYGDVSPIVCDVDKNNDGKGDIIWQYWKPQPTCGGVPHNYYVDQAGVIYQFVCGGETNPTSIEAKIFNEVNPEFCE